MAAVNSDKIIFYILLQKYYWQNSSEHPVSDYSDLGLTVGCSPCIHILFELHNNLFLSGSRAIFSAVSIHLFGAHQGSDSSHLFKRIAQTEQPHQGSFKVSMLSMNTL